MCSAEFSIVLCALSVCNVITLAADFVLSVMSLAEMLAATALGI